MEKERLLAFFLFQIDVQKKKRKKILHLLPAQLPTNFQQRITRYGALSKPSKSGAGSPLSSQTDPSFRLVNPPVHLKYRPDGTFLNFNRAQRRYTLFPPKLSTPPSPRLHTHIHIQTTRSFSKRSTRSCSGDFVKQSIKARCRQIYGGSVVAFPARKQLKFMPTAWIIRFRSRDQPPKRRFRLSVCEIRSRKVCESSLLPLRELQI